jgi:hypothetical protein
MNDPRIDGMARILADYPLVLKPGDLFMIQCIDGEASIKTANL